MDDKPKNLCLDLPQFNTRKPYHLEIDNDGNILYPENKNKKVQIVRVKSRHNSLDNLEWIPRVYNVKKYKVNGLFDLGMTHKELIGQTVELVKIHKSGLYQIKDNDGHLHNIPKCNLDSIEE